MKVLGTVTGMRTKKLKQPVRHLRLLKPHRSAGEFSFSKISSESKTEEIERLLGSPSDLNIPKELIPFISKRIHEVGSLRLLLNQCLRKRSLVYSIQFHQPKNKVSYQKQRLGLVRYSFRPYAEDWAELKKLAVSHGVSMCRMFIKILELDLYPEPRYAEILILEKLKKESSFDSNAALKTGT